MKKFLILLLVCFISCLSTKKQTIQYEIRGTLVNIENKPIDEVEISFYNDGKDFGFVPISLKTNENGMFFVKSVKVKEDYRISKILSDKLPSKIIFNKEGYKSDTIKIDDYRDFKNKIILINKKLVKSQY